MNLRHGLLLILSSSWIFQAGAESAKPKVIYGEDGRKEITQCQNPDQLRVSESTLAIIPKEMVHFDKAHDFARIVGRKYGEEFNLCKEETFVDQPMAANCSGSLVGKDLVATAGHCVTEYDCDSYMFVFGFQVSKEGVPPEQIPSQNIFSCKEIVAHKLDGSLDYALVRLDRVVPDRQPLKIQDEEARSGDEIYVIGHPGGLPTKIAEGAQVRNHFGDFFNANLDTYGGNSGSAVFNAKTHEVLGILVRGETDFIYDEDRKCFYSHRCEDGGCRGEDSTSIRFIREALKKIDL